jgi:hypothetical protein
MVKIAEMKYRELAERREMPARRLRILRKTGVYFP